MKLIYPAEFKMHKRKLYADVSYLFGISSGSVYKLEDIDTVPGSYEVNPTHESQGSHLLRMYVDKIGEGHGVSEILTR